VQGGGGEGGVEAQVRLRGLGFRAGVIEDGYFPSIIGAVGHVLMADGGSGSAAGGGCSG
jgi:hypothetical protein